MYQLHPDTFQLPVRPEGLAGHFEALLKIAERFAQRRVGLFKHSYHAVPPCGWEVVFGRHRTRVRFRCDRGFVFVQQADAPADEWYPDWEQVKAERFDWDERQSSEYEVMEKILHERFAA